MANEIVTLFGQADGMELVEKHCRQIGLGVGDLQRLVEEVIDKEPLQRRHGLWQAFDEVLDLSDLRAV